MERHTPICDSLARRSPASKLDGSQRAFAQSSALQIEKQGKRLRRRLGRAAAAAAMAALGAVTGVHSQSNHPLRRR